MMPIFATTPTMATAAATGKVDEKLMDACRSLEGFFLSMLTESMGESGSLFGSGSSSGSGYSGIIKDSFSSGLADAGGIGLAAVLYDTLNADVSSADTGGIGGDAP